MSIVTRACTTKAPYTMMQARARVRALKHRNVHVTMYRCPFANDHEDSTKRWHVGHPPSLASLEQLARAIRARQGYPLDDEE